MAEGETADAAARAAADAAAGGAGKAGKVGEGPQPGPARPFRIFHMSDIHFGNHFDESVWNYVGELARRERPDLVVCTGDLVDHGGLFMLAAARREFDQFVAGLNALNEQEDPQRKNAASRQVGLRAVPGNHDCGPWGNLKFRPFSTNFGAMFGAEPVALPNWMPTYLAYRRSSFPRRCLQRVFMTPALYAIKWSTAVWRFVRGLESGFHTPLLRKDDPDEVVLVYLDSNHAMRLATGNVNAREVTKLKALLLNLRDEDGAKPFVPRIALLHHHPLPIPEASIEEGLTSFEPFLVLRNAGLLLKELNKCDVDLILHGHKHYAAFGRLGYSIDHHTEGEIAVLAAGSGGVTHSESGRNSVNLIDILETGRMSFRSIHFGAGGGAPVHEIARGKKEIHGIEMHKARVHRRAAERQGQWIEKVMHAVGVDATGVAVVQQDVSQHSFERPQPTQVVPVVCSVSLGRVSHNTIELSESSKSAGHQWVGRPQGPVRLVRAGINVGRRLTGPAVDYGYRYKCFNTYAITRWETVAACEREALHGRPGVRLAELEATSYVVRAPLRMLVLKVQLPAQEVERKPFVQVMRWSTYPATPLDEHQQFHEHGTPGEWVNDAELTAHEAANLAQIGDDLWELRVTYPMVGHRYDVRWRVEPARRPVPMQDTTRSRGRTLAMRATLLDQVAIAASEGELRDWEMIFRAVLSAVTSGANALGDAEIAMFAYDESCHDLVQTLVLAPTKDYVIPTHPLVVPLGEGVIGAAFKRSQPVMYVDPLLSDSKHEAAYLYSEDDEDASPAEGLLDGPCNQQDGSQESPKGTPLGKALSGTRWKYVLAFPISSYAAKEEPDWGPHTTVGVLTVSSERLDSGLVELVDQMDWQSHPPVVAAEEAASGASPEARADQREDDTSGAAGAEAGGNQALAGTGSAEPASSGPSGPTVGEDAATGTVDTAEEGAVAGLALAMPARAETSRERGETLWTYANLLVDYLPESVKPAGSPPSAGLPTSA